MSAVWRGSRQPALVSLAGRFDAAHAHRADCCRVRGVRRQDHLVSRAELDVAACGVEHDLAAHAIQHLFVAVLMPVVGIAGPLPHPCGLRPSARMRAAIWSSPSGAPSCRLTAASAPIAEPHHRRECRVPSAPAGDGSRELCPAGIGGSERSFVTESNSALRVPAQVPADMAPSRSAGVSRSRRTEQDVLSRRPFSASGQDP